MWGAPFVWTCSSPTRQNRQKRREDGGHPYLGAWPRRSPRVPHASRPGTPSSVASRPLPPSPATSPQFPKPLPFSLIFFFGCDSLTLCPGEKFSLSSYFFLPFVLPRSKEMMAQEIFRCPKLPSDPGAPHATVLDPRLASQGPSARSTRPAGSGDARFVGDRCEMVVITILPLGPFRA